MVRVSDATGGTPTAASWATASDERNKRSGQLSAEKGRKFHNDLAGYPRQPRMPDKIPARGWKSQGKYPQEQLYHVRDIRREEMICIDYFLGTQDFAYERGRDEAAARGLAAVGKLTEIVEVENETWQGAKFGVC